MGPQVAMSLAEHGQFQYDPWLTNVPTFRCPSDPGEGFPAQGRTNYGVNLGDSIQFQNNGGRNQTGSGRRHQIQSHAKNNSWHVCAPRIQKVP